MRKESGRMKEEELRIRAGRWLLPREDIDKTAWACVACDQFTSQPEYWAKARAQVMEKPSALKLILPECELEKEGESVPRIHAEMEKYVLDGVLQPTAWEGFILTERATQSGTRIGLVALMDLEGYDYNKGSKSLIRPTEGTIVERIPPRLAVRRGASLELSHVMMLLDDVQGTVIEPLKEKRSELKKLYDFSLMMGGGHITGYAVTEPKDILAVTAALETLAGKREDPLLYAVGDGNHSLATAKAYWEEIKAGLSPEEKAVHPARFAMAELVNLHDAALLFEPIHRVLFGAEAEALLADMAQYAAKNGMTLSQGEQEVLCVYGGGETRLAIAGSPQTLAVGTLQVFLDEWLLAHPEARLDYVHGEQAVRELAQGEKTVGFLLPVPDKSSLFDAVSKEGALPRKTFSMGAAEEKRYYMEARALKGRLAK